MDDLDARVFETISGYKTADDVLRQRTVTLEATVNDPTTGLPRTHAMISDEMVARATADFALAQRTTTLEASYAGVGALMDSKITVALSTYSDATHTQAMINTSLSSAMTNLVTNDVLTSTINQKFSTYADLTSTTALIDTKIASAVTNLVSNTTMNSTIDQKLSTYADLTSTSALMDTKIASAVTNLVTNDVLTSTIDQKLSTYSDTTHTQAMVDTKIASAVTNLVSNTTMNSTIDQKLSTYSDTTHTQAMIDTSIASNSVNTLTGAQANALIDSKLSTYTTPGGHAVASWVDSLTTTVGTMSTTVTETKNTVDGISGKWGVQINNNGRITGIALNSGATSTSFNVTADSFNIIDPNNVAITPFSYSGGQIHLNAGIVVNSSASFQSSNYKPGAINTPPSGFKLVGTPYTSTYVDGTQEQVLMEIGGAVNIGGYHANSISTKVMDPAVVSGDILNAPTHFHAGEKFFTGQGIYITPKVGSRILVFISIVSNGGSTPGIGLLYYGQGTKPNAGACEFTGDWMNGDLTLRGTIVNKGGYIRAIYPKTFVVTQVPNLFVEDTQIAIITGLVPGTTYWIDLATTLTDLDVTLDGNLLAVEI
jgi:hypothetical protein